MCVGLEELVRAEIDRSGRFWRVLVWNKVEILLKYILCELMLFYVT